MIFKLIRGFSQIAYTTAKSAHLSVRMLDKNSVSFNIFKSVVQVEELQYLRKLFVDAGFELRIAGGAVRDILCEQNPNDLDFATTATPQQMINLMRDKENIRLITTPAGERHGTVSARINDKHQYEITTLRVDKITDGRHAEVEFINDWKLDASRRDLTINSLFLGLDGTLYDYFNGERDIKEKNICFVGNAEDRIKEDYLRIFRYFRFHARYGYAKKHDQETLGVIKKNADGLLEISGERIWSEMKRILNLKTCRDVIHVMFNEANIGKYFGFSDNRDLNEFDRTLERLINGDVNWEAATLFAAIVENDQELLNVSRRLKLSNFEKDTILYILANRLNFSGEMKDLQIQLALHPKSKQDNLRRNILEFLKYQGLQEKLNEFESWQIPSFPIRGDIIGKRVNQRKLIGLVIDELKMIWAKNNFTISEQEMEEELDKLLQTEKYQKILKK